MAKGRAASPRRGRWLVGGFIVLVLVVAVAWVLFVPTADWLAHLDVGSANGSLLQKARDAARGRLLTLGAGLVAAAALLFTARNFILSREGQVTDRYTKAIEQLGSDKIDVRIGGIFALERIARDSAKDHPTVMEVLTAFVREHSREMWPPPDQSTSEGQERSIRPDIQAALAVVVRRDKERDVRPINLAGAVLMGADFSFADLAHASFYKANLQFAQFHSTKLNGAIMVDADLTGSRLFYTDLRGAILDRADLTGTDLTGAYLDGACLDNVILKDAHLLGASFFGARMLGVDWSQAGFADLTGVHWDRHLPAPEGWKLHTDSGALIALDEVGPPLRKSSPKGGRVFRIRPSTCQDGGKTGPATAPPA